MENFKIPKIGESRTVYLRKYSLGCSDKSFKAFYLGRNPVITDNFWRIGFPEGHVFARENKGEIEIYCTRNPKLNLVWMSDGDSTCWPLGIEVKNIEDIKLGDLEKRYLKNKFPEWKKRMAA